MQRNTGLEDKNYNPIYKGAKVVFCGHIGEVTFECGAFGVAVKEGIDYKALQKFMDEHEHVCCGNPYVGCKNDNFISLWEIAWNFNCYDDDCLWVVEVTQ